jgi:hypothetical protein
MNKCPLCGGEGQYMGSLGKVKWFRCRNCGIEWRKEGRRLRCGCKTCRAA